jgi:hypothetical protein
MCDPSVFSVARTQDGIDNTGRGLRTEFIVAFQAHERAAAGDRARRPRARSPLAREPTLASPGAGSPC